MDNTSYQAELKRNAAKHAELHEDAFDLDFVAWVRISQAYKKWQEDAWNAYTAGGLDVPRSGPMRLIYDAYAKVQPFVPPKEEDDGKPTA